MAADGKKLARLHRVRTLQLGLTRAEEAHAHEKLASEELLAGRIRQLADAVAPVAQLGTAASLHAAAHFRDRLGQSALAAEERLRSAGALVDRAREATRAAKRDQTAVEKLLSRARAEGIVRAMRALEETPPAGRRTGGA